MKDGFEFYIVLGVSVYILILSYIIHVLQQLFTFSIESFKGQSSFFNIKEKKKKQETGIIDDSN